MSGTAEHEVHFTLSTGDLAAVDCVADTRFGGNRAAVLRAAVTEYLHRTRGGKHPVCDRDHLKWGHGMPMDRILTGDGGWECPGILADGTGCGYRLPAEVGTVVSLRGHP